MMEHKDERLLKHALLERLMHYHYIVGEKHKPNAPGEPANETISSAEIAKYLTMDDTLVRKDLAAIGVRGYPRVGFKSAEVLKAIREVLGFDDEFRSAIIGAGRMGGALASYRNFARYGLAIMAAFDNDPAKHGTYLGQIEVQPMECLEEVLESLHIRLAILTVPAGPAQAITDRLVRAGIRAIWNFAPDTLAVPDGVTVRHEHISVGLAELAYHLKQSGAGRSEEE